MKRLFLGFLCAAGVFGAYVYWPSESTADAYDTHPEVAAPAPDQEATPVAPGSVPQLTELDDSEAPLEDVHAIQAQLQELREGPRAQALREMLDRVSNKARQEGTRLLNEDPLGAWRTLSLAYFATTDARVRDDLKPLLDKLASDLVLSRRQVEGLSQLAEIPAGGTLTRIAKDHGTSWRIIARANGIADPKRIRAGDRVKVPDKEVRIHVRKRTFLMMVTYDGGYLRSYRIGTGESDRTPETLFSITEMEIEPTWYGPDGEFPYGHEKNILGTRWLGFNRDEYCGFGIHGTRYPETIGTESSAGCIRMRNEDVEELFDLVNYNAQVSITK